MNMTRAVDASIQAVSPVSIFGTSYLPFDRGRPDRRRVRGPTVCTGWRFRARFGIVSTGLIPTGQSAPCWERGRWGEQLDGVGALLLLGAAPDAEQALAAHQPGKDVDVNDLRDDAQHGDALDQFVDLERQEPGGRDCGEVLGPPPLAPQAHRVDALHLRIGHRG